MNIYDERFSRTQSLIGKEALNKLKNSHVALFGIGGVGSYTAEALVRSGIGNISIFDGDKVNISNINRQLLALQSSLGQSKVELCKNRISDINPKAKVFAHDIFYTKENHTKYNFSAYDYVIDAIDMVSSKLLIIENAYAQNIPVISCMGTGNKLDPTMFEVADIYKTSVCPLARVMRKELKERNIKKLKVVYSREIPQAKNKTRTPASISFVPPVAGFILASEVIKDLAGL